MDAIKDFAISTIAVAPSPTTSGVTLSVDSGHGDRFPQPSTDGECNLVIFPEDEQPLSSNAEKVRLTGRVGDTLTITREQEGTTARDIQVGDIIMLGVTAKYFNDLKDQILAQVETTDVSGDTLSGLVNGSNQVYTVSNGSYTTGKLVVYRNGVRQLKGTDWSETDPSAGTFTFATAPLTGDTIEAQYT